MARNPLGRLDADALVAALEQNTAELDANAEQRDALYADRLAIFQEARRRNPPVTQKRLAAAARVSEVAVIQALRKAAAS